MNSEQTAYCEGWKAVMAGADPRFVNPYESNAMEAYAWNAGALDAFDAEDGEEPEPECAGF